MLKKIEVKQVRLGMHIHELCGPWMNHPFWRTKFILTDVTDLRHLQESGITELWIDSGKGLAVVLDQSTRSLLTPQVKVFFSTKSQAYIPPEVVDLSRPNCPEKILGKEDAAKWGIRNLHELWAGTG